MSFVKSFDEAAQQAILKKMEDGSWEKLPWLMKHVYDWRIMVSDREKNHANSFALHFSRPPTQEEFEENQRRYFDPRTHYVHVNKWNGVDWWDTITTEYNPHFHKPEKAVESFTTTEEWPEGKTHRVKFWDQRVNALNYVYFDYKPSGMTLSKYHSTKVFAVVEARPNGN